MRRNDSVNERISLRGNANARLSMAALWLALAAALGSTTPARSEQWPQRPVRVLVPFAPGGNTDGLARLIGQWLGENFRQPFVIENHSGASGARAAQAVTHAPADGYTLLMATMSLLAILPASEKVAFDPLKDFAPISNIGTVPLVLLINQSVPAATLDEFLQYVRRQPGKIPYASGGIGSFQHLSMALLAKQAGIDMIHVPYKGGGPAIADVIAGRVSAYFAPLPEALPQVHGATLRALAITDVRRHAELPNVPTVAESGFAGFRALGWNGLVAPAATPRTVVEAVAHEVQLAVKDKDFAKRLTNFGVDPLGNSPEEFTEMIAEDVQQWRQAVAAAR